MRLLCSAERQKHAPDFSIDKLQAELRSFRDNEAPKRVVRKVPNKDPVCWDPGPIHGRTSWRLKNGGGFVKSKQFVPRFPVFLPGQTWPGCMLLGLAEAQLAKALAGEAISTLVEEVAGHLTRDEQ